MKRKVPVVGACLILISLFLLQTSAVYASAPTNVTFEAESWAVDATVTLTLNKKAVTYVIGYGVMAGDIAGNFEYHETIVQYFNSNGALKYTTYEQLISIETSEGAVVLQAKFKSLPNVPLGDVEGTWRIIGGTDLMAAVKGRGTCSLFFIFEGKVK